MFQEKSILGLRYPLTFTFKITSLANDFTATDAVGNTVAFAREKILKLKDHVQIYSDDSRSNLLYEIRANQWIDWSASYRFTDALGNQLGRIGRRGWRSLWKATYDIYDEKDQPEFQIKENNAWIKVLDGMVNEIPIINLFTGYFLNPSYKVFRTDTNDEVAIIKKQPSFFGRKFLVDKTGMADAAEDKRIMLGLMMMVLLERRRG